ncbi:MAG: hypothetical protein WAO21_08585 [Verrucomicrobiia bacterium]
MFTKGQLYILAGCILAAACIFAVYEFWLKPPSQQPDSSVVDTTTNSDNTQGANSSTTATESHRELPEPLLPDAYFKLTADSHTDVEQAGGHQEIDADMVLEYTHQRTNDGIIVTLYSMELKMYQDGVFVEDTIMTRDKIVQQEGNQKTELSYDEEPPEQQAVMAASFATNLCKITLDADQNEMGRQILSDAGFAMLKEGNLNTLRFMHGPYHRGAIRWQGVRRIPMTMGIILDCPLDYTKASASGNEVSISGSLSKDEVDSPQADVAIKNVACGISGHESFDETIGDYTSGKTTLQYKFQIFQNSARTGTLDGKIELSLERITAKM